MPACRYPAREDPEPRGPAGRRRRLCACTASDPQVTRLRSTAVPAGRSALDGKSLAPSPTAFGNLAADDVAAASSIDFSKPATLTLTLSDGDKAYADRRERRREALDLDRLRQKLRRSMPRPRAAHSDSRDIGTTQCSGRSRAYCSRSRRRRPGRPRRYTGLYAKAAPAPAARFAEAAHFADSSGRRRPRLPRRRSLIAGVSAGFPRRAAALLYDGLLLAALLVAFTAAALSF